MKTHQHDYRYTKETSVINGETMYRYRCKICADDTLLRKGKEDLVPETKKEEEYIEWVV